MRQECTEASRSVNGWRMNPDLVRIVIVCREDQKRFEGAVGFLIDTSTVNGHDIHTVHIPSHDVDVRCREVTAISKAQQTGD